MKQHDLDDYRQTACDAARAAAKILEGWRAKFKIREKGRFDLVTDADVASQHAIFEFLNERFPDHRFLGEEGDTPGADVDAVDTPGADASGSPLWIVDPIDGTTNYIHDCPFYSVSIGLLVRRELVVGVVYDPVRDEMFSASKGSGAYLNGERLQTSSTESLGQSLLALGFPTDIRGREETLDCWRHFSFRTQALRRMGSSALNLAYVAAGRFDGFWGFDNHIWDVSGGVVLVREAGGIVTNINGDSYDPFTPDVLASNGPLHSALVHELGAANIPY